MAIYKLNIKDNIYDTLLFWLKEYAKFKLMTLSLKNATPDEVRKIVKKIDKAKEIDDVYETAKTYAKKITSAYNYILIAYKFIKWITEKNAIDDMKDINTYLVIEFLNEETIGKSKATMLNYRLLLINFFKFIEDNVIDNFSFKLQLNRWKTNLLKIKQKAPEYLKEEEIDRLLDTIEKHIFVRRGKKLKKNEDLYLKAMYRFAIMLALVGGFRISEIANLKENDIYINSDLDVLEVYVKESKNQKSRIVTLPYSKGKYGIKKTYEEFLNEREKFIKKMKQVNPNCELINKKYLFVTDSCKKLSSDTMERVLEKLFKEAGIITAKKGMHLLRHTHASLFYKKTKDILLLKERLGHEDLKTTKRYTHLDEEKIKKSADAMR
jgi:integrase/recombinase XerD